MSRLGQKLHNPTLSNVPEAVDAELSKLNLGTRVKAGDTVARATQIRGNRQGCVDELARGVQTVMLATANILAGLMVLEISREQTARILTALPEEFVEKHGVRPSPPSQNDHTRESSQPMPITATATYGRASPACSQNKLPMAWTLLTEQ
jgi:hypothetical protein